VNRYKFRLEQVLRVRRVQEELARADLQAANREVERAEDLLHARFDRYRTMPAVDGPLPTSAFLASRDRADLVAAGVVAAGALRQAAREQAAERRRVWSAVATRVTGLERLDERRRAEHTVEAVREEDRQADEVVVGRYRRANRATSRDFCATSDAELARSRSGVSS
jgi:flagellar protein FliJ